MDEPTEIPLRVCRRRELAEEWALVLVAAGLSPSVQPTPEGFVLGIASEDFEHAMTTLAAYERENPPQPLELDEPAGSAHLYAAAAVAVALLDFFFITDIWDSAVHWLERGNADAARILQGELWRTVTALTLHADIEHVLANAVAGAIFLSAVCRAMGPGLGCALVLLTGAGGNLINAFFYGSGHLSIGASTAVFGAVGVLGALGVVRRRRRGARGRYAWVPIAAGLGLLAMLGAAGERVDLLAHLFGFLLGAVLGLGVALLLPRRPGVRAQWVLGGAALAAVILAWALALR